MTFCVHVNVSETMLYFFVNRARLQKTFQLISIEVKKICRIAQSDMLIASLKL